MFFKKIKIYFFIIIFIVISLLSLKNILHVTTSSFAQNISIRDNLLVDNDYSLKGTHGISSEFFFSLRKNNMIMIATLNFKEFIKKIKLYRTRHTNTYANEINILNLLVNLSFKNHKFRKESLIFIPRNVDNFWKLSCDTHMPPLLVPSFSNIAAVYSLPDLDIESCFGHLTEYGYYKYYLEGKVFTNKLPNLTCNDIDTKKYVRLLILNQISNSSYQFKEINCIK